MSRHTRQQKRRARLARERECALLDKSLVAVSKLRFEETGKFPRWASTAVREAILRGAL